MTMKQRIINFTKNKKYKLWCRFITIVMMSIILLSYYILKRWDILILGVAIYLLCCIVKSFLDSINRSSEDILNKNKLRNIVLSDTDFIHDLIINVLLYPVIWLGVLSNPIAINFATIIKLIFILFLARIPSICISKIWKEKLIN